MWQAYDNTANTMTKYIDIYIVSLCSNTNNHAYTSTGNQMDYHIVLLVNTINEI